MKKFNIQVIDTKEKKEVLNIDEFSNFKKFVETKYKYKYNFPKGRYKVTVTRLFKKPGKQIDLLDMINECEKQNEQHSLF